MSNRSKARRKSRKGVVLKKGATTVQSDVQDQAVALGDIYQSVVATYGFDPIREAEERRRLS